MKKNSSLHKLNDWKQQTAQGLIVSAVIELALAYGFASWAIDSGSLLIYFAAAIFLIGAIRNFVKLIKVILNGTNQTKPARRAKK